MDKTMKETARVVAALAASGAHTAVKYVSPNLVVRATRVIFGKRKPRKSDKLEVVLTVGKPNYRARRFIKACLKAGEPFPVRKIQLHHVAAR